MRIVRRLMHVLIIVVTLVIGAAAAAVIVSQTAWFKNWLRGYIVAQANQFLNGTLSIERLGGNLFFGIEMENIGVSLDGSQVVAVKDLGLDYNVFSLITKGLSVDSIRLDKPVIYLRREGDTWSLSRLVKKEAAEADREGPLSPIAIDAIELTDGSIVMDQAVGTSGVAVPKRFEHLDARLSFNYEPVRYSIEITQLSFRGSEPALALNALSGGVAVKGDTLFIEKLALRTAESSLSVDGALQHYLSTPQFNVQITSDKLSLPEFAKIIPALAGVQLQPALELKLDGPMDRLGVTMNVRSSAGQITGQVVADLLTPGQSVAGDLSVRQLDLAPILNDPRQKTDLTADAHVDIRGETLTNINALHGDVTLDSPRLVAAGYTTGPVHTKARIDGRRVALDGNATAYGAAATFAGTVTLPDTTKGTAAQPIDFDVRGLARHVDLRKLPRNLNVPPAATSVNAGYHVSGSVTPGATARVNGDLRFEPSSVAGAEIAAGSLAGFSVNGEAIGYSTDATVSNLDLQRLGQEFNVPALATDRYKSAINGHIVANGSGTTAKEMEITARGTLTDSTILGGTIPSLDFDGSLVRDTAHIKATGSFAGFDPAVASGRTEMQGTVGGTLDVDATVASVSSGLTPDSVQADAKVTLGQSTIGGLAITRANVDGTYHDSTGEIRAFELVGRDVNAQASGTIALNETGQSNLKIHADSPSLEEIGKLFNQPIAGIGKVDATVTGNRRELQAAGNVTGNGVKYGDNGALTITSDFTAKVPDLAIENAHVVANSRANFITVGGQNINELEAKTTYEQKRVAFDATAKQPQRIGLAPPARWCCTRIIRKCTCRRSACTTQGQTWQMASGSEATINYAERRVAVTNLTLDQRGSADCRRRHVRPPGDALNVTLANVDVPTSTRLLLRPPQLTGRVNASGTITGTKDAPDVKAEFQVARAASAVSLRIARRHGELRGAGLTLDAQAAAESDDYLTAKGYVPTALFKGSESRGGFAPKRTAHRSPPATGFDSARGEHADRSRAHPGFSLHGADQRDRYRSSEGSTSPAPPPIPIRPEW
jgi:uncharacterized protein involved in outer membrane biogenesis